MTSDTVTFLMYLFLLIVEMCDNFKYLGITFDCKLKWSNHCTLIVSKCKHKHERGVGILLDEQRSKCLIGYWTISDRIMLVKLKSKPFDISIIQVYAPTADKSEEEHDTFYNDLEMAKSQCKFQDIVIVMG